MKDITTRSDVEFLVDEFYKKVIKDDTIGFFFTQVMKLDWETHIPVMYNFWESILLGKRNYKGNPMLNHVKLNQKSELKPEHFNRWLLLWEQTIKEHFTGNKSEEAISRAKNIGALMQIKIQSH